MDRRHNVKVRNQKIRYKQLLIISCLLFPAIAQICTSIGAVQQLSRKHTFYDVMKSNWTGDGVLLGYFLSQELSDYQPITLYYPKGIDNIKNPRTPFWFIYFWYHTQPYLYPGRVESRDYDYILSSERSRELGKYKLKSVSGRYQTFVIVYPTDLSSSSEYRMYSTADWKTSIVVPEGLW